MLVNPVEGVRVRNSWSWFCGILLTVARVLGDFFPRTSRPSGALAVKGV
ncbi:hypothetical protein ACMZ7O_04615 [Gardnerella greenwoodii]|nr:hypothetical protein [Gardnerella vaginalis]